LIPRVLGGNFQGVFLSWNLDLDPDLFSLFHSSQQSPEGQNFVFYRNPEADRLIEQARVEPDEKKRNEIFHRLHAILAEDQPYTWTFQVSEKWGVNRRIHDVRAVDGLGLFWWYPGSLQWWIPVGQQHRSGKTLAAPG
jgi:peptide/nickel transport system substrate-binding protein